MESGGTVLLSVVGDRGKMGEISFKCRLCANQRENEWSYNNVVEMISQVMEENVMMLILDFYEKSDHRRERVRIGDDLV